MNADFYNAVRPLFGGRLKQHQVDGMEAITAYAKENEYPLSWTAYALATAYHETAAWMQPIREGARRYGPNYSDASARRAVASIFARGIIRTNYALPHRNGRSYYGRGLVQITWHSNYSKFTDILGVDLVNNPDLTLEMGHALDIMFIGMRDGVFTGHKLKSKIGRNACDFSNEEAAKERMSQYVKARRMINGDVRKNGAKIARQAIVFEKALQKAGF